MFFIQLPLHSTTLLYIFQCISATTFPKWIENIFSFSYHHTVPPYSIFLSISATAFPKWIENFLFHSLTITLYVTIYFSKYFSSSNYKMNWKFVFHSLTIRFYHLTLYFQSISVMFEKEIRNVYQRVVISKWMQHFQNELKCFLFTYHHTLPPYSIFFKAFQQQHFQNELKTFFHSLTITLYHLTLYFSKHFSNSISKINWKRFFSLSHHHTLTLYSTFFKAFQQQHFPN